jgi:beta-glucosidase-like glycosyl hydrolase
MKSGTFILLMTLFASTACGADTSFSEQLSAQGRLRIPLAEAKALEAKIGQLLVVNVDGFGATGDLALEPGFVPMVEKLQVGGVIPHYGSTSYERIRRTNRALAALTRLPLLLCCDIVKIRGPGGVTSFGDGYVGGFLGRFRPLGDAEMDTLARLNAFAFAAIGINVALGPTVDTSTGDPRTGERARRVIARMRRYGLEPVLKHFPFLPARANLHHESPDTRVPPADAEKRYAVFHDLAGEAGIMMTTHLYDSLVDRQIATFSTTWNAILRKDTGFGGLLMSDGLLMLRNYADRSVLSDGSVAPLDPAAGWAVRAVLAGHDMVIVEGSAAQTERVFAGLLAVACGGSKEGAALRARIEESYGKIAAWKTAHAAQLGRAVEVKPSVVDALTALLPGEKADLAAFRFDPRALARLEPSLAAAETGE